MTVQAFAAAFIPPPPGSQVCSMVIRSSSAVPILSPYLRRNSPTVARIERNVRSRTDSSSVTASSTAGSIISASPPPPPPPPASPPSAPSPLPFSIMRRDVLVSLRTWCSSWYTD